MYLTIYFIQYYYVQNISYKISLAQECFRSKKIPLKKGNIIYPKKNLHLLKIML